MSDLIKTAEWFDRINIIAKTIDNKIIIYDIEMQFRFQMNKEITKVLPLGKEYFFLYYLSEQDIYKLRLLKIDFQVFYKLCYFKILILINFFPTE